MGKKPAVALPRPRGVLREALCDLGVQLGGLLVLSLFPVAWVAVGFPLAFLVFLGFLAFVFWPRRRPGRTITAIQRWMNGTAKGPAQ
jgi:hypothetical protein